MSYDDLTTGSKWVHRNGNQYVILFQTNIIEGQTENGPGPDERYPRMVVYQNTHNGTRWSRRADDWHRSMTPFVEAPGPVAADNPAKREPLVVNMAKEPLSLRPDLPTTFTFTPSVHQFDRCVRNTGRPLQHFAGSGGFLSWQQLAAILEFRPESTMRELQAVMVCLRVVPQPGFVL